LQQQNSSGTMMTGEDHPSQQKPEGDHRMPILGSTSTTSACAEQCGQTAMQCKGSANGAYNSCVASCVPGANMGELANLDSCKQACATKKEADVHACTETGTSCKNSCPKL
jgi:hypothetical protein